MMLYNADKLTSVRPLPLLNIQPPDQSMKECWLSLNQLVESDLDPTQIPAPLWGERSHSNEIKDDEYSTLKAITSFKNIMQLVDGGEKLPKTLPSYYKRAFSKSLKAITKSIDKPTSGELVEMSYGEFYSQFVVSIKQGWVANIIDIKHQWPGTINYTICMTRENCKVTFSSTAVVESGKINRIRRKETRFEECVIERVSGQVKSLKLKHPNVDGLPTELELSSKVLPLPKEVRGKLFVEGSAIAPAGEEGQIIKLFIEHASGRLSRSGRMPVRACNGVPYAGGVNIKKEFKQLSQQVTFVLNDSNGEPVAKCIQDKGRFDTGYTIYGTRPLYKGDKIRQQERGVDLYQWFRFCESEDKSLDTHHLSVWTGDNFKPLLKTFPIGACKESASSTNNIRSGKIIIQSMCGSRNYAFLEKQTYGKKVGWGLTMAPGGDPAVLVCLGAILEDSYGPRFWAMSRMQSMPVKGFESSSEDGSDVPSERSDIEVKTKGSASFRPILQRTFSRRGLVRSDSTRRSLIRSVSTRRGLVRSDSTRSYSM